jgi:8-oxo-dGTP pyrophosphatase MutT (NUDIX family)
MTESLSLEEIFRFDDDGPRWPAVRPKDAASLVLVRRERKTVRVLMAERHSSHVFLPGRFVFPGGRLEAADLRLAIPTDLRPEVRAKVAAGTGVAKARGLALAAVRETFEETGLIVGEPSPANARTRSPGWARFFAQGIVPKLERLEFVARAVTPPGRPRRFDADFSWRMRRISSDQPSGGDHRRIAQPRLAHPKRGSGGPCAPHYRCICPKFEARLRETMPRPAGALLPSAARQGGHSVAVEMPPSICHQPRILCYA